jgi:Cft2 family RNA processing exonuclease
VIDLECLTYGVGHAGEGICLLFRVGSYRIMLDCGLSDLTPFIADKSTPPADVVFCSHAHADHARGLLQLHQRFPKLPIYASEVTTQLVSLNWGTWQDRRSPQFCQALPWRTPVEFLEGLSVELVPAGHLPGAAAILLTYTPPAEPANAPPRSYKVLYTGDFFLSNTRLVEGLPLDELRGLKPDVLIIEGSYGTARHPHRRQQENHLADRINHAIAQKRSILFPVSSLGLGQELLMLLRSHHYFTGRDIDIWVDEQVAEGCDAYLDILPHLPTAIQNFARHQPLFWDERVRPRVRRLTDSHRSNLGLSPCIVLTDEHADLSQYLQNTPSNWLVLNSQHPHAIASSSASASETYLLAQHGDGLSTTQLIHNVRPQHVMFVHGTAGYLADLAGLDELHNRYHLHAPLIGSRVELPIGETFIQPAPPEATYLGQLNELDDAGITITLPYNVTADPRWRSLSDTSLIEARWQGEELVLRGVTQRELLQRQDGDRLLDWMDANSPLRNCCGNCRHYRSQRCWNSASPLFEFRVTPDGFCPVFASAQEE